MALDCFYIFFPFFFYLMFDLFLFQLLLFLFLFSVVVVVAAFFKGERRGRGTALVCLFEDLQNICFLGLTLFAIWVTTHWYVPLALKYAN